MVIGTDGTGMSRQAFSVSYSGSARLDDHTIDVEALAPALVAFGRLIREANFEFNGKKSTSKVFVVSDFEHECFQINFEALVNLYQQLQTLLGVSDVKTAKEVLEWIGLFRVGKAGLGSLTFFEYLKWKKGRKVESTEILDKDPAGTISVKVEGDNNKVIIYQPIFHLANNAKALKAARDAFTPIGQDGFEDIEFRNADEIFDTFKPLDSEAIIASCNRGLLEIGEEVPEVETTTAWLSVYSPVFDEASDKWRFKYGKDTIYADISNTNMAHHAIEKGGVLIEDAYQVRLEITTPRDRKGKAGKPTYKILQIIKFIPGTPTPPTQVDMFNGDKDG
jgi:hypothetical protein